MMRGLIVAAFAAGAQAQNWGTTGSWELVLPVPLTPGKPIQQPTRAFHHATFVPGSFILAGNDTSSQSPPQGSVDLYTFNIVQSQWAAPFDFLPATDLQIPFLFSNGGSVMLIDEMNPSALFSVDSAAGSGPWTSYSVGGLIPGALGRRGQRFLSWGSTLYMWGGVTAVAPFTQANDLYALDLTQLLSGATPLPLWVLVSPPGDATTGIVANYPPGRVGYTWTGYQVGAIMFGGISTTTPGADPIQSCLFPPAGQSADPNCFYHHNVWAFLPGMGNPKAAAGMPTTSWVRLGENGANGGPVPDGRVEHAAGSMGDQLYIYGGVTAKGLSNELWAYNLVAQTWQQVTPSSPSPPAINAPGIYGWSVGTVVGRHFYIFHQTFVPGQGPQPGSGQLWRWAPSSSNGGSGYSDATARGHTAGIVIGILIGFANLYFLVLLALNAGVMPSCGPVGAWCSSMCGGLSSRAKGVTGFYSSSPVGATSSSSAGGYMAPSNGEL